ncbi:amidase [Arthrobacter sp. CJ23]|uniref:amidase n=1 Tax=Arthrobacter sp. CJ23 TaxID=2972479 RepID=UPI00215C435E|nr:amidase [Arthrobacter sp. CJ23]UVJ39497.1 amidase [Arthrobacter sp. CJ23]
MNNTALPSAVPGIEQLTSLSMTEWARALREGQLTAVECLELHLERIAQENPRLNAVVTLNPRARQEAEAADAAAAEGRFLGPLHGVPFTVKDTLATKGLRSTAGSPLLGDYVPEQSATAVRRLQEAGAVLLGKANCSEFAVETHSRNPLFGDTWNPWDTSLTSGGSTGGDSAAVASGMSAFGLGTDFGGSIRWPAHCTGIASLRPTAGLVPETGLLPYVPPADGSIPAPNSMSALHRLGTVAWLARSVEDLDVLLGILAGPDGVDPSTVPVPLGGPVETLAGITAAWFEDEGTHPVRNDLVAAVRSAAQALEGLGVAVTHGRPPGLERAAAAFVALRTAEGMPDVVELATGREDELGGHLHGLLGAPATVVEYRKAAAERDAIRAQVLGFMEEHNILLLPVASVPASDPRNESLTVDGKDIPWTELGSCCRAISILGFPVVVVPCGLSEEGLPAGIQVVGRPYRDREVLAVAAALEQAFGRLSPPPFGSRPVD